MSTRVVAASREIDGKGRTSANSNVRPNAPGSRVVLRTRDEQPVSIFQQLARGHPSGGDDVRAIPLSLRNVEDLLAERGIDISHETVRFWWNRFGPMFAAEIRKKRVAHIRGYPQWRWHLDEVFVKVTQSLLSVCAVDHDGEVLEAVVTAGRDKPAAPKFAGVY
jgi:hypothetical protein